MKPEPQHPFITALTCCCHCVSLGLLPRGGQVVNVHPGVQPEAGLQEALVGEEGSWELHRFQKRGPDSLTPLPVGKTKVSIFSKDKGPGNKADAHNSSLEPSPTELTLTTRWRQAPRYLAALKAPPRSQLHCWLKLELATTRTCQNAAVTQKAGESSLSPLAL